MIAFFAGYEASTVVDTHTVTVTFSQPNAPFPQAVATSGMGIVGPATLAVPFEDRATGNLVGTGPFVLESYTDGLRDRAHQARGLRMGARRPVQHG